jgi:general stress protein YciG
MSPDKQKEIASKGGRAAHAKGTAHQFTPEEAAAAGRKGGKAAHAKGTAHQFTPEEAAAAGRKGGKAAHAKGAAHRFTSEEAAAAGRKGGKAAHAATHRGAGVHEGGPTSSGSPMYGDNPGPSEGEISVADRGGSVSVDNRAAEAGVMNGAGSPADEAAARSREPRGPEVAGGKGYADARDAGDPAPRGTSEGVLRNVTPIEEQARPEEGGAPPASADPTGKGKLTE